MYLFLYQPGSSVSLASSINFLFPHFEKVRFTKNCMIRTATGRRGLGRNVGIFAQRCHNFQARNSPTGATAKRFESTPGNSSSASGAAATSLKHAKTTAGTGDPEGLGGNTGFSMRGPVTWPALGLVAVAAASAVAYYKIERERRLENAMGKIVSESIWFLCLQILGPYY